MRIKATIEIPPSLPSMLMFVSVLVRGVWFRECEFRDAQRLNAVGKEQLLQVTPTCVVER
jgi:hypothetical protein